jgi:hypothetical protein
MHTSRLGQTSNGKLGYAVRSTDASSCSYDVSHVVKYCDRTKQPFLPPAEHAPGHLQINTCLGEGWEILAPMIRPPWP